MATETMAIIEAGGYRSPSGRGPAVVAAAFAAGLATAGGSFDQVIFAVLDRQRGAPTHAVFARAFGRPSLMEKR